MSTKPITPKDILADGVDSAELNGKNVRKGTIAAFLANVEIFEDSAVSEELKNAALVALQELAPNVIAIGLHKHVVFKNPRIEEILLEASEIPSPLAGEGARRADEG